MAHAHATSHAVMGGGRAPQSREAGAGRLPICCRRTRGPCGSGWRGLAAAARKPTYAAAV
eukprot:scaffold301756_cov41-Tisochrysis_lutea.AAC.1